MVRKKKAPIGMDIARSLIDNDTEEVELEALDLPVVLEPEKKSESVIKPPEPVPMQPLSPGVRLEVFLRISGKRLEQMGGFRRWAINNGLQQMDVKDWRKEYEKFLRLPV